MQAPARGGGVCWNERNLCAFRPLSKGGHTCQALRLREGADVHSILVFGGGDAYGVSYNDIVVVEPDDASSSCSWRCTELQPTNAGSIRQRMGHSSVKIPYTRLFSAALVGVEDGTDASRPLVPAFDVAPGGVSDECLVLFGGWQAVPTQTCFNDCHMIALHPQWQTLIGTYKAPPLVITKELACTGMCPAPRHSHASCLTHGGAKMTVLGGSNNERVLGDCFQLCFTTRVWQEVAMPHQWIPREMASMVTLRDAVIEDGATETGWAVVYGGRRGDGELLDDAIVLSWSDAQRCALEVACVPSAVSQASPVCCHTLLRLSDGCALSVGGLGPPTNAQSGAAADDDALIVTAPHASVRVVRVPRQRTMSDNKSPTSMFGFGHSSCTWRSGKTQRHVVIDGLVPDAASGVLALHELVWQ